jgi:hypothetical protein
MTPIGDSGFDITNVGWARIIQYQLGCVSTNQNRPFVVSKRDQETTDLPVSEVESTLATHVLAVRVLWMQSGAKLSVVWVRFNGRVFAYRLRWTPATDPPILEAGEVFFDDVDGKGIFTVARIPKLHDMPEVPEWAKEGASGTGPVAPSRP